jgi:hypothetical protein
VIVGQTLVIEAEAMEQGRVQVVHREPHQPLAAVIVTIRFLRSTLNFLQRNLAAGVRDVSLCCCRLCQAFRDAQHESAGRSRLPLSHRGIVLRLGRAGRPADVCRLFRL